MAQKKKSFLGLFSYWAPADNSNWRRTEDEAEEDIANDMALNATLPDPVLFDFDSDDPFFARKRSRKGHEPSK